LKNVKDDERTHHAAQLSSLYCQACHTVSGTLSISCITVAAAACRVQRVSSTCESLDVDSESKYNQFVIKVLFRRFISKISKLVDKMQRCLYELSQHLFAILASEALRPQSFSASHSSTGKTPEGAAAIGDWMGLDFVSWRQ
jgi:hypothetical protein